MAKRIVAALCAFLWAGCGYIGVELVSNVAKRGVPGYPSAGQWELYVIFPAVMTLLGIALAVFAKRAPVALYGWVLTVEIVAILPFLLMSGGGI